MYHGDTLTGILLLIKIMQTKTVSLTLTYISQGVSLVQTFDPEGVSLTLTFFAEGVSVLLTFADKLHTFCIRLQTKMLVVGLLRFTPDK